MEIESVNFKLDQGLDCLAFFCKGKDGKCFRLCWSDSLCCPSSALQEVKLLEHENSHRQYMNDLAWLCPNNFYLPNQTAGFVWWTTVFWLLSQINKSFLIWKTQRKWFKKRTVSETSRKILNDFTFMSLKSQRNEKEISSKKIFEVMMAENFPNLFM